MGYYMAFSQRCRIGLTFGKKISVIHDINRIKEKNHDHHKIHKKKLKQLFVI